MHAASRAPSDALLSCLMLSLSMMIYIPLKMLPTRLEYFPSGRHRNPPNNVSTVHNLVTSNFV